MTDRDVATIQWLKDPSINKATIICSVYMDIRSKIPEMFTKVVDKCVSEKLDLVVCADTNSWSSLWNSAKTNARGTALEAYILSRGLVVQNRGDTPTFVSKSHVGVETIIDVTMTSEGLKDSVLNWTVHPDQITFSDHNLITFEIAAQPPPKAYKRKHKVDWAGFVKTVEKLTGIWHLPRPDNCTYSRIMSHGEKAKDIIIDAYARHTKEIKVEINSNFDWYNDKLRKERSKVDKLYKLKTTYVNDTTKKAYDKARLDYDLNCTEAREKSWSKLCSDTNSLGDMSKLFNLINRKPIEEIGLLLRPDGSLAANPTESMDILLDHTFRKSDVMDPPKSMDFSGRMKKSNPFLNNIDILEKEGGEEVLIAKHEKWSDPEHIKAAINSFVSKKAGGFETK